MYASGQTCICHLVNAFGIKTKIFIKKQIVREKLYNTQKSSALSQVDPIGMAPILIRY